MKLQQVISWSELGCSKQDRLGLLQMVQQDVIVSGQKENPGSKAGVQQSRLASCLRISPRIALA
jgi:hypothetical protein